MTRAQLSATTHEQQSTAERLQALKNQYATMQSEFSRKEEEHHRLQAELDAMQQELLLASQLSSVNAVQPYRAEVESLRHNLSTLEASHRHTLEEKDHAFATRLATLRRQYDGELAHVRSAAGRTGALPAVATAARSVTSASAPTSTTTTTMAAAAATRGGPPMALTVSSSDGSDSGLLGSGGAGGVGTLSPFDASFALTDFDSSRFSTGVASTVGSGIGTGAGARATSHPSPLFRSAAGDASAGAGLGTSGGARLSADALRLQVSMTER